MIDAFTVPADGNYRCKVSPLDEQSSMRLVAVSPSGDPVTIAEWAGTNPLCSPRGGTVDVHGIAVGTILKVDRREAQLEVDRLS